MREAAVYSLSFMLTAAVIGHAFHQKKQFYPAVVFLTKSNVSLAVLAIQSLIFVVLLAKVTRKIFFGHLRAAEVEHLIEKSWYAVTETCLAFTVFREDFNTKFVAMFVMLLFFKCFHWLAEDRVDYMERSPMLGIKFHLRINGLVTVLGFIDTLFITQAYFVTVTKGASAQLVFGFEYSILLVILFTVLVKYILHCIDLWEENPWENKAVYLLYLELVTSAITFLLYVIFVGIMSKVHTFPLFAIRPLYLTMRTFKRALNDVVRSRRAIRNMNQLYPDATEEELQSDDVCIICREHMVVAGGCKKLPCNHIFHASCLRSWFQRQQTCPTCRMELLSVPTARIIPPPAAPQPAPAGPQQPPAAPAFMGPAGPFVNPWQALQAGAAAGMQARAAAAPPTPAAANPNAPATPDIQQPANQNAPQPQQQQQPPPLFGLPPGFSMPAAPGNIPTSAAGAMPPPQMFPFMPMPPPAMPPVSSLSAMTEDQLRQMEKDEREALEARIQWLRDIQTLLDAAVEQMNQYSMVMSVLNSSRPTQAPATTCPTSSPTATPSTITVPGAASSSVSSVISPPPYSPATADSSIMGTRPKSPRKPETRQTDLSTDTQTVKSEESPAAVSTTSTMEEDVRRRRLARFESRDTSTSDAASNSTAGTSNNTDNSDG